MSNTLLIDLDDTLLFNPLENFMPAYIKLLSIRLAPLVTPEKMVPQLLAATDCMIKSNTSAKSLEQTFDDNFYPVLGLNKTEVISIINDFYQNEFNELQSVTRLRPEAIQLIEYAVSKKYTVVVATNPLFPQSAMRSRLKWAGFTDSNFPFEFVTSYENMHFSKPNPAYYAEILGLLGWPHGPVCMVGNSLKEDVIPPSSLGLSVFWVDGKIEKLDDTQKSMYNVGPLEEVKPWLEKLPNLEDQINLKNFQGVIGALSSTPATIQHLTKNLNDQGWKQKKSSKYLSILELVSHLLDVEIEINAPRIDQVLSSENPFITGVDSDPWISDRQYQTTRTPQVAFDFLIQRQISISKLIGLTESEWMRPARHSFFGPTTLFELVKFIAIHDIDHIRQIYSIIQE